MFPNIDVPAGILDEVDCRIRRIVNRFLKRQSLQKSYFDTSLRNGGLEVPNIKDGYIAYKIHQIATLISTTDWQGILDGYLNLKRKVAIHLSLVGSLGKALNHLHIKWLDWDEFVQKRR
jgi:hypothetical protein